MNHNNNTAQKYGGDEGGERRNVELEMYDGLVDAGLVKPCTNVNVGEAEVPQEVFDTSRLLQRMDAGSERVQCTGKEGHTAASADPDSRASEWLFNKVADPRDEAGQTGSICLPRPASERLPSLLNIVHRAFVDVRGQWSTDRVIADPELGDLFLRRCWELGAHASDYELNWTLLYGRKNGRFPDVERARRFSMPRDRLDEFSFASEMAARFIQEQQWKQFGRVVSLDKLLCDPVLAAEFDGLASRIAPGYSILEYRWAALALRKAHRSLPGSSRLSDDDFEDLGYTRDLRIGTVPKAKGIYCFVHDDRTLFIGHTESLRRQVSIHFDTCGTRIIPGWMDGGNFDVRLTIAPMAGAAPSRREITRSRQIALHRPRFNWLNDLFAA